MFELASDAYNSLMCQFGTSKNGGRGRQKLLFVLTGPSVAMESSLEARVNKIHD
jgi:hypothetical protein